MNPERLDALYTALSEALARAGEDKASLLLAMLSLDLLAQHADFDAARAAIERAERLTAV